jgi:hypothetical protein
LSDNSFFFRSSANAQPNANDGIGAKFDRFLKNIQLTESQKETASARHYAIRQKLESEFPGSKTLLVGSHAKNTSIRPPADLDVMLILPQAVYDKYNSWNYYGKKPQSQLLQEVKNKIQKYYPNTAMKADGQVIIVPFASSFAVEIVPAFKKTSWYGNAYIICDTNSGGKWKDSDPEGENSALTKSNSATNGNSIRLIKMMKRWKMECNVSLKSIHIELLAQDFLKNYEHKDKTSVYFDWMVRDFFAYLIRKADSVLFNSISHPTLSETFDLGTFWRSRAESAYARAQKAIEFGDKYPYSAIEEWRKIFGKDFTG